MDILKNATENSTYFINTTTGLQHSSHRSAQNEFNSCIKDHQWHVIRGLNISLLALVPLIQNVLWCGEFNSFFNENSNLEDILLIYVRKMLFCLNPDSLCTLLVYDFSFWFRNCLIASISILHQWSLLITNIINCLPRNAVDNSND